jgi:hypothetical protein
MLTNALLVRRHIDHTVALQNGSGESFRSQRQLPID